METLKRYIELEEDIDYHILTAWVLGTYFFPIFAAYPFIHLKAPKGSGKSQCLALLRQICFNAIKARPTLAALGDTVDSLRGTYLIDQADSLGRIGHEELLDIFCDSYKRSGGKRRIVNMDKARGRETLEFETYSPKAFASIKELPEDLRDRCIIIQLKRSICHNFPDPEDPGMDWKLQRGKLYELLLADHISVGAQYDLRRIQHKNDPGLIGRKLELWLPIEVMLACFGQEDKLDQAQRRFFIHYGSAEYEPGDLERATIDALILALDGLREAVLSPKTLAEKIELEYFRENTTSAKQRAAVVGAVIKKFNLASEKRRGNGGMSYLFRKETVESIYASYFKTRAYALKSPTNSRYFENQRYD